MGCVCSRGEPCADAERPHTSGPPKVDIVVTHDVCVDMNPWAHRRNATVAPVPATPPAAAAAQTPVSVDATAFYGLSAPPSNPLSIGCGHGNSPAVTGGGGRSPGAGTMTPRRQRPSWGSSRSAAPDAANGGKESPRMQKLSPYLHSLAPPVKLPPPAAAADQFDPLDPPVEPLPAQRQQQPQYAGILEWLNAVEHPQVSTNVTV